MRTKLPEDPEDPEEPEEPEVGINPRSLNALALQSRDKYQYAGKYPTA